MCFLLSSEPELFQEAFPSEGRWTSGHSHPHRRREATGSSYPDRSPAHAEVNAQRPGPPGRIVQPPLCTNAGAVGPHLDPFRLEGYLTLELEKGFSSAKSKHLMEELPLSASEAQADTEQKTDAEQKDAVLLGGLTGLLGIPTADDTSPAGSPVHPRNAQSRTEFSECVPRDIPQCGIQSCLPCFQLTFG